MATLRSSIISLSIILKQLSSVREQLAICSQNQCDRRRPLSPFNTTTKAAIVISSTMNISVQTNHAKFETGEGYLGLPLTTSSTQFNLASYWTRSSAHTEFSIISPYNDTSVTVSNVSGYTIIEVLKLSMSENDVYQSGSQDPADYTGLYVTSTKPISVFSGHSCAYVPTGTGTCDHLVEQMPPVSQWGKTFVMAPFYGRSESAGFIIRVIAKEYTVVNYWQQTYDSNNNPIDFTGFRSIVLNNGEWNEAQVSAFVVVLVNCSLDCLVMQYSKGQTSGDSIGEPDAFMVTVPSIDHYTNNIKFSTSRWSPSDSTFQESINGVTIIAEATVFENIYLDNENILSISPNPYRINVNEWTSYITAIVSLQPGFHSVTSQDPNAKYLVFVYGHKSEINAYGPTSYGYLGGYGYIYGDSDQPITPPDACDSSPCLNGGTCEIQGDSFVCHCPSDFYGPLCETGLEGSLFYLTFLNNYQNTDILQEIFVTGSTDGYVRIKYNFPYTFIETFQLNSMNNWQVARRIDATEADMCPPFNTTTKAAIVISSMQNISVQLNSAKVDTGDGYLGLPLTTSSTHFYIASYSATSVRHTEFSIVSPYENTSVTVADVSGSTTVEILKLNMSENEVYQSGSLSPADYTGLYVTATKPIAVISGHSCAYVPTSTSSCDHLVEQMPPVSQWGKTFIMAPFYGRSQSAGFIIRVIAQEYTVVNYWQQTYDSNNNPIDFTGFRSVVLNNGQWDEATVNTFVVVLVNCSLDCLVMQYSRGYINDDTDEPDAFMVTVPSINHYTNIIKFSTSRWLVSETTTDECINGITIIAESTVFEKIYLYNDNILDISPKPYRINVSEWTSYTAAIVALQPGFHSVTSEDPGAKYAVLVYGHKELTSSGPTSYGYLGGYGYIYGENDQPIRPTDNLLIPSTSNMANEKDRNPTARVRQNDKPQTSGHDSIGSQHGSDDATRGLRRPTSDDKHPPGEEKHVEKIE